MEAAHAVLDKPMPVGHLLNDCRAVAALDLCGHAQVQMQHVSLQQSLPGAAVDLADALRPLKDLLDPPTPRQL
eukprot:CAMPEP_0174698888 /NCGR_PEP_ID=MMETSP1094-20130205/4350_1 /TAXON_ID=156173 /ORGANISM="Chrysochromulina brevifilum, Strain UTEX LB 985" /LENGTH=72 /DNA_ID=CAMNT_0015896129 /DNA_START=577 /DNA_END=795 /DNA_ORIENTATION=-